MISRNSISNIDFFEIVKENKLLTEVFDYNYRSLEDIECYVEQFKDMSGEKIVNNTQWLYRGDGDLTVMLGLYKDNIIAISEDFELFRFCDYFQDLPFEIYRRSYELFDDIRDSHEDKLKKYETWCKNNGIIVDPNNYYHDENGEISKGYFELEKDYNQDIINENI